MGIDKLLTEYVDSLNNGKKIDIADLLAQCPKDEREELKRLVEMVQVFKKSTIQVHSHPQKVDALFAHLEQMRAKKYAYTIQTKAVSNFRANNLSEEEKKKVKDKLSQLFEEEFGDE